MLGWGHFVWNLEDIWKCFAHTLKDVYSVQSLHLESSYIEKLLTIFLNVLCSNFCNFLSDWSVNSEQDIATSQPVAFLHN